MTIYSIVRFGGSVASKKKGKSEGEKAITKREVELRQSELAYRSERLRTIANTLVKMSYAASIVGVAYFVAGHSTSLEAVFNGTMNQWFAFAVASAIGGAAGVGWKREHSLRLKEVGELSEYAKKLEKTIDPGRSTAGLNAGGKVVEAERVLIPGASRALPSGGEK